MSAALAYVPPEAYQAANDNDHMSDGVVTHLHKARHCRGLLQLDLIHWIKSPGFARPFPKHLGSAQTGTSQNGTVAWREQYILLLHSRSSLRSSSPLVGETMTNPLGNADLAGYTGHIKDSATGLNYMQARYYDPLIGRFLSIDPINFSPDAPYMFNRFTYVNNDPVNNTDPTGMQVVQNGVFKVTVSQGVSVTGGATGTIDGSVGIGADTVQEIGIGLPAPGRGIPLPIFPISSAAFPVITLDAIGVTTTASNPETFTGVAADIDVGEVGISLGGINDRAGIGTTGEVDVGSIGGEITVTGRIAGSVLKGSVVGPIGGATVSKTETEVVGEVRFDGK